MRVLMTGGAGYVGSACLRSMLRQGHDAVAFDDLSEGNAEAVPSDRLIAGDICDREALASALRGGRFEAVMHFAAVASVPDSIRDPDGYWRINALGTKNVLDAMRDTGVERIIFSSTAATYSFAADMPLTEESAQEPEVPYGSTKLAAERMIREYVEAYGIAAGVLRYFNASGADADGRHGESRRAESHLVPLILAAAVGERDHIKIFGTDWDTRDGSCVRDFVHVEDIAQAHELVLGALAPGRWRSYNVGSGSGTTVLEVLHACEAVAGRTIPRQDAPRRSGDPGVLVASAGRLISELGWKPRYPDIQSIVESAWRWHSSHPKGYASDAPVQR